MKTLITSLIAVAILFTGLMFIRGSDWISCTVASSDLGRKTEFSWISGKCMVFRANGEKVYLNQIRDSSDPGGE